MKLSTPISQIMTPNPVTLTPVDLLDTAYEIFKTQGIHHVLIVSEGQLVGVVSFADYLRVIRNLGENPDEKITNERLLNSITMHDVMTDKMVCLHPDDSINDALQLFKENRFHAIPIIDGKKKLLGIVTTYDMMLVLEK
jgi:acetoin utilization protein AcuB